MPRDRLWGKSGSRRDSYSRIEPPPSPSPAHGDNGSRRPSRPYRVGTLHTPFFPPFIGNVELESGVTRRLSNYAEEMKRKVKMLERNLSCEFSDEADSLRDELKKIDGKIGDFLEKSNRLEDENKSIF